MQQRLLKPQQEEQSEEALLTLHIQSVFGCTQVPAAAGFRLVELLRAGGFPIKAECDGAGVCATCHVRLSGEWLDKVAPPTEDEIAKLDEIPSADDNSRLACQIIMTAALDGLEVEVQPDSLGLQHLQAAE